MQQLIEQISSHWRNFSDSWDPEFRLFYNRREFLSVSNQIVLFGDRIVISSSLREKMIKQLHKSHSGIVRMKILLVRMFTGLTSINKSNNSSNVVPFAAKSPTKTTLSSWPLPSKPWERIHIDYAGPIKSNFYLLIIDAYSKWPGIMKTSSASAAATLKFEFYRQHSLVLLYLNLCHQTMEHNSPLSRFKHSSTLVASNISGRVHTLRCQMGKLNVVSTL